MKRNVEPVFPFSQADADGCLAPSVISMLSRRRMLQATGGLLVAGAGSALLAACGGSPTSAPQGTGAGTASLNPNAVLTIGQAAGVVTLDPNTSQDWQNGPAFMMYDTLTTLNAEAKVLPSLATSWDLSADGLTWTFHLRDDVKYHDGRQFTSHDALLNINRVLDPATASQWRTLISSVTEVQAPDATTLILKTSARYAQLPAGLFWVSMTDVPNIANVNKTANGTGKYKFQQFVPNDTLSMVANHDYWGDKPKMAGVKVVAFPDNTAAEAALRSGTLLAINNAPNKDMARFVSDGYKLIQSSIPSPVVVFQVDDSSAPFSDLRARQALAYATDRESILKAAYAGIGLVNDTQSVYAPRGPFYDKSLPTFAYNLAKAKELFTAAGVKGFEYWTTSQPTLQLPGEILQASLAQIGVKVKITVNDVNTWVAGFTKGKWPGRVSPNVLSFNPAPDDFGGLFYSKFHANGHANDNWLAPAPYNDAVAALQAATTTDDQMKALATIQQIFNQESPDIVIGNSAPVSVASPKVVGLWALAIGNTVWQDAGITD